MSEGGIASWKKAEGDTFSTGDVLVEIVRLAFSLFSFVVTINTRHRKPTRLQLTWRRRMMASWRK
jgi:hypothetical protein